MLCDYQTRYGYIIGSSVSDIKCVALAIVIVNLIGIDNLSGVMVICYIIDVCVLTNIIHTTNMIWIIDTNNITGCSDCSD